MNTASYGDRGRLRPEPVLSSRPLLLQRSRSPGIEWLSQSLFSPPGSKKAAAHRLSLSHSTVKHHLANAPSKVGAETTAQLVWILAERLPEPEGVHRHPGGRTARLAAPSAGHGTGERATAKAAGSLTGMGDVAVMRRFTALAMALSAALALVLAAPSSANACTGCSTTFQEFLRGNDRIVLVRYVGRSDGRFEYHVIDVLKGRSPTMLRFKFDPAVPRPRRSGRGGSFRRTCPRTVSCALTSYFESAPTEQLR